MKKKLKKKEKVLRSEPFIKPLDILFGLIILAYILVPTFTPNLMALDTNTPKFFTTAILNLVVFIVLGALRYFKHNPDFLSGFFKVNVSLVYIGFLIVSLLSFTQAVNTLESTLQFTKIFTVFAAVFNLGVILMRDLRYAKFIVLVMAGLLIFDSVSVFYHINKFINGEIAAISDIKTVYSNKNILASAIFVKLAFAIWLMVFEKGWLNRLGWLALAAGIAATFFMATRAFYLGLLVLYLAFITYNVVLYFRHKNKRSLLLATSSVAAIIIAFFAFTFVQQHLYPEQRGRHTQGVLQQLATLKNPQSASRNRSDAWRWSIELIKEKPLLGVGSGNWKVEILKHENQQNPGFIYLYKAHNDFLETAAETGIIGGLLFFGLFIFTGMNFLRHYTRKEDDPEHLTQYLFLAAAGVAFYSVDAVFNFPADRPEILALFIIFLATGIAATQRQKQVFEKKDESSEKSVNLINKKWVATSLVVLFAGLLSVSAGVLYLNFQSSINQRIVYQEIMAGTLKERSEKIIPGFPFIPNVSIWGESIATLKARYLIQEEKYQEAIDVLSPDQSTPWDARREFFMAMAFNNIREYDSALHYSEIAAQLKPNYFRNIQLAATLLERKKEDERVAGYYERYLENNKRDSQAWLLASNFYIKHQNYDRANELIDEAMRYLRGDTLIQQQQRFLNHRLNVEPHLPLLTKGSEHYQAGRYSQAVQVLSDFIDKVQDNANAFQLRSFSHYYLKNYEQSIADANNALAIDPRNNSLINLRGVCYRALDNLEEACKDFKRAMDNGNESGKTNYDRFCAGR